MRFVFFLILLPFIFLSSCQNNDALENDQDGPYMKLSSRPEYKQDLANNVKMRLKQRDELSKFHVVNDEKTIVIAFDVDQIHRFSLGKLEHEIQEEMDDLFEEYEVTVSTDLKIILDLGHLEKRIHEGTIAEEQIKEEVEKIIKLTKDEA